MKVNKRANKKSGSVISPESKKLRRLIFRDCFKMVSWALLGYLTSELLTQLLAVYTAGTLGAFADAVFALDVEYGMEAFVKLLLCIGGNVLLIPLANFAGDVILFYNALRHDRLVLGRFMDKSYVSAMKISEGEAQSRLDNDPNEYRLTWTDLMYKGISLPFTLAYLLYCALRVSAVFTLIICAVSLLRLIVPTAVRKLQAKYDMQTREYNTKLRAYETEITAKPHTVRLYGLGEAFIGRLDALYKTYFRDVFTKSVKCTVAAQNISAFLDTFCVLLILLTGAAMVAAGKMSAGSVAAMVGYFAVFNTVFDNIGHLIKQIPIFGNVAQRMETLYEGAEDLTGIEAERVTEIGANALSFAYDGKPTFSGINFKIKTGEKIAVTGANGSGKSTLIKLLCGLLNGYGGSLTLNGIELNRIAVESWRGQIAYAEQEPYLFTGSVRENIRICNLGATDDEIDCIMSKIGIAYLSRREVSMNQNDLSGGEKQKISIARALIKDTPVLILDEPGNNLDAESLKWLGDFIKTSDKTVLYISHDERLSDLADIRIGLSA